MYSQSWTQKGSKLSECWEWGRNCKTPVDKGKRELVVLTATNSVGRVSLTASVCIAMADVLRRAWIKCGPPELHCQRKRNWNVTGYVEFSMSNISTIVPRHFCWCNLTLLPFLLAMRRKRRLSRQTGMNLVHVQCQSFLSLAQNYSFDISNRQAVLI